MIFTIHDVGHGSCISLIHENGNVMLWDCGHNGNYRPSNFLRQLGVRKIDGFFITNYDEDHISDLPNLMSNIPISSIVKNASISADQLRDIKLENGPLTPAMESLLDMLQTYTGGPPVPAIPFPRVTWISYYNLYDDNIQDTNNLSVVTVLTCNGVKIIIPGDMEKKGWESLLEDTKFINDIKDSGIFIASHHGRESGYCKEVLDLCNPEVIVFSDSNIMYATQEMSNQYSSHARGIYFNGQNRFVLTTRNDGMLQWKF